MAINQTTGVEEAGAAMATNISGQGTSSNNEPYVDATPTVKIDTGVMQKENATYDPTKPTGVSGIMGTNPAPGKNTNADYLARGYTQDQINAEVAKKTATSPTTELGTAINSEAETLKSAAEITTNKLTEAQVNADENQKLALEQEKARIAREQAYADSQTQILKDQELVNKNYEAELQIKLNERAQQQTDIMKPMLAAEEAADKAELTALKAKNEKAINDANISMEVEKQHAALNLNRMGLAFSTAGVNTMLQVHDQGVIALATVRTQANYMEAELGVQIQKNIVEHANTMNKIINDSVDEVMKSKKRVVDFISDTNKNILLTEKQKNDNIDKATSDYRKEKTTIEEGMYVKTNAAVARVSEIAKQITATIKQKQTNKRDDLNLMIQTGVLSRMSPAQLLQIEQEAGLPPGTAAYMQKDTIVKSIAASLQGLPGFGIAQIPADVLGNMTTEIVQMTKMGIPMNQATTQVMEKYLKDNQKYQDAVEMSSAGSKIAVAKAGIDLKNAQTILAEKKAITEEEKALTQEQTTKLTKVKAENQKALMDAQIAKYKKSGTSKGSGSNGIYPGIVMGSDGLPYKQSAKGTLTSVAGAAFIGQRTSPSGTIYLRADGSEVNSAGQVVSTPVKTSDTTISGDTRTTVTGTQNGWQTGISTSPYSSKEDIVAKLDELINR